jgi:hypothetical protein
MNIKPVYLWLNETNQQVAWVTPSDCGECPVELKKSTAISQCIADLRDQSASIALIDCVGETLSILIETWLAECEAKQIIRLYLVDNLPEAWQALPLEWCRVKGEILYQHMQVLRYVPFYPENLPVTCSQSALFINLWPKLPRSRHEHRASRTLQNRNDTTTTLPPFSYLIKLMRQYPKKYQVVTGSIKAQFYCEQHDITQHSLLCVIAHGSENGQKKPFLTNNGNDDWALPEQQLPPLVLLLACGSEEGNLIHYALRLLSRGAKTVLAPIGKLDATQVELFLEHFLEQWQMGKQVHDILGDLQQDKDLNHAALRIRLIGQGGLYQYQQNHQHPHDEKHIQYDASWSGLQHGIKHNEPYDKSCLVDLLNQLTYRCLMQDNSLERSVTTLYDAFGFVYNDPHEDACLYLRLKEVHEQCWPITQHWLHYYLLFLSSLHDHHSITLYRRKISQSVAIRLPNEQLFFYYLMHGFYRKGNYAKAMEAFVLGFNEIERKIEPNKARFKEPEYKLSVLSINIFIDMNFPSLGNALLEHSRYCLEEASLPYDTYRKTEFTLLDQEARLLARNGQSADQMQVGLTKAIMKLERKRELAQQDNQDGHRELASLLSLSTWLDKPNRVYAEMTLSMVADTKTISEEIRQTKGNCTALYLLRALASWAWHQNDQEAYAKVKNYLPVYKEIGEMRHLGDAGPIGFIIAYLALLNNKQAQQLWPMMASKLENDAYFLELSIFHALLNDKQESKNNYRRFSRQQQRVLNYLDQLTYHGFLDDEFYKEYALVKQNFEKKRHDEYQMLEQLSTGKCTINALIEKGFLPF